MSNLPEPPTDDRAESQLISLIAQYPDYWRYASHLSPADFRLIDCSAAWLKLKTNLSENKPIDGREYLTFHDEIYPVIPTAQVALELADRVSKTAHARSILHHLSAVAQACYKLDIEQVDSLMANPPRLSASGDTLESVSVIASRVWDEIMNPDADNAIPTGLAAFDKCIGGLVRRTSTILAARPGMGKSAALVQMSDLLTERGYTVAVFSREMSAEQWLTRMACRRLRVSIKALTERTLSEEIRGLVANEVAAIGQRHNLYIDGGAGKQTTEDVMRICEHLKHKTGALDFVMGDHARLFDDTADNETHRQGKVTWGWKRIAKQLETRGLLAAQLSRAVEGQTDKHPDLKDLRDSGEIEENADNVVMLYRNSYYDTETKDKTAEFMARKARDGERNLASKAVFLEQYMHFGEPTYDPR